ncbi:MAG: DUF262 domain-containing protein [Bacteroidales bacterium]|nr:DUF262 domain-containing protein [Bacteroidales bacterium]
MTKEEILLKNLEETKNSLSTDRLDMSFGEIMSMYERKEIIIDPIFQRLFRWTEYQQTRFIESLLLGIPIPPIFVAEDKDGRWELVDGLQRISTVFSFFGLLEKLPEKNDWILKHGELIPDFENFGCKDLPLKLQLNIKRAVCRIEIVKWNSKYDMRYELFNRLNTGGARLTDQEIRNCIFRGVSSDFNLFLSEEAKQQAFIDLIGPTEKQVEELYLDELVLRFCALYNNGENVRENISEHMTSFMKKIVTAPERIDEFKSIFNRTITLLKPIGKEAFRGSNNVLSTSLYDGISIGIAQNIEKYEEKNTSYLIDKINQLKGDSDFRKASGSAANSKTRILKRLQVAHELFERE